MVCDELRIWIWIWLAWIYGHGRMHLLSFSSLSFLSFLLSDLRHWTLDIDMDMDMYIDMDMVERFVYLRACELAECYLFLVFSIFMPAFFPLWI
jgi:hypothetical protein